jgi:hypothetical protein
MDIMNYFACSARDLLTIFIAPAQIKVENDP